MRPMHIRLCMPRIPSPHRKDGPLVEDPKAGRRSVRLPPANVNRLPRYPSEYRPARADLMIKPDLSMYVFSFRQDPSVVRSTGINGVTPRCQIAVILLPP